MGSLKDPLSRALEFYDFAPTGIKRLRALIEPIDCDTTHWLQNLDRTVSSRSGDVSSCLKACQQRPRWRCAAIVEVVGDLAHRWRYPASTFHLFFDEQHRLALVTGEHLANMVAAATLRRGSGVMGVVIHATRLMQPGEFALWGDGKLVASGLLGSRLEPTIFDAIALHIDDSAILCSRLGNSSREVHTILGAIARWWEYEVSDGEVA